MESMLSLSFRYAKATADSELTRLLPVCNANPALPKMKACFVTGYE
jgi:hypothetical protein